MQCDGGRAGLAPVDGGELIVDREHAVDRRLVSSRQLRRHHLGIASVVAIDRVRRHFVFQHDDVAEFDVRALAWCAAGRQRRRQDAFAQRQAALRQSDLDGDGLQAVASLRISDLGPADDGRDRVVDRLFRHAVELQSLLVDGEALALGTNAVAIIDVDDEIDSLKCFPDLCGCLPAAFRVRPVDFGEQRREHRRPGRRPRRP